MKLSEAKRILNTIHNKSHSYETFEYPTYGGANKNDTYKLSSEFVDAVEIMWPYVKTDQKNDWVMNTILEMKRLGMTFS